MSSGKEEEQRLPRTVSQLTVLLSAQKVQLSNSQGYLGAKNQLRSAFLVSRAFRGITRDRRPLAPPGFPLMSRLLFVPWHSAFFGATTPVSSAHRQTRPSASEIRRHSAPFPLCLISLPSRRHARFVSSAPSSVRFTFREQFLGSQG